MAGSGFNFEEYANPAPGQAYGSEQPSRVADSAGFGGVHTDPYGGPGQQPPPGGSGTVDYGFGSGVALTSPLQLGKPPVYWLVACATVGVGAGIVAWLLGESLRWAIVAWVASGPVAIGLLAAFNVFDTRARARTYARSGLVTTAYVVCLVLAGLAVCGSALRIAFWVGRL